MTALSARIAHGLGLGVILVLGTSVWAADIPALLTPSDAAAARYPDLARSRAALLVQRTQLRDQTIRHNQECGAVEEGSQQETLCRRAQAALSNALQEHGTQSNAYYAQVQRAESCVARQAARDRLEKGLPVQLEAIQRTDAQLRAARQNERVASADAQAALVKGAAEQAKAYAQMTVTQADALRGQVEALKGLDATTRDGILRAIQTLAFGGEKLLAAGQAGYQLGRETQTQVDQVSRAWAEIYEFLLRSRLLEQGGIQLSNALAGPAGGMAFRGALTLIDVSVALGSGVLSQADQQAAEYALGTLRTQVDRARQRIAVLDQDLAAQCR